MTYKPSTSSSSSAIASTTAAPGKRIASTRLNGKKYGRLLAEIQPTVPRTPREHRRLMAIVEPLLDKGSSRTREETALADVLVALISRYEQARYNPQRAKPFEILQFLMEEHGLRQRDLLDIFPTRSRISEVLSGKRAVTREQAILLGKRLGVDASVFIELA